MTSVEERFNLIRSIGEECIEESELIKLLESGKEPNVYDGFEPSGKMHLPQGILRAHNVNKFTKAGCKFTFWVADWFAQLNLKFGGDLKKIQTAGKLMIEVWKACGMDMNNVEFKWSSEEVLKNGNEYWSLVFDIATRNSLDRVLRCTQIMGRSESDKLMASQIFYPIMQCADVFFLKADICSLGMDQRKVNILAREHSIDTKRKFRPIIISHHMIIGLNGTKMSKSDPDNAIFMTDTEAEVNRKIKKAFCPPGGVITHEQLCDYVEKLYNNKGTLKGYKDVKALFDALCNNELTLDELKYPIVIESNPLVEYAKYIVMEVEGKLLIERDAKYGNNVEYTNKDQFVADYLDGKIHPSEIKPVITKAINRLLEPVRKHFRENEEAKKLLETVNKFK